MHTVYFENPFESLVGLVNEQRLPEELAVSLNDRSDQFLMISGEHTDNLNPGYDYLNLRQDIMNVAR